jgi:hypothetical protein
VSESGERPHCIVAWSFKEDAQKKDVILIRLFEPLSGRSWVQVLPGVMAVSVASPQDYKQLVAQIGQLAKSHLGQLNIFISPMAEGGAYSGCLAGDPWEKLKAITGAPKSESSGKRLN